MGFANSILEYDPPVSSMQSRTRLSKGAAAQSPNHSVSANAGIVCGEVEARVLFHRVLRQPPHIAVQGSEDLNL